MSQRSRITRRMAQDELSAMEQNARLAMFHQHQQFQLAVFEHQRLARDAVSQAVLNSSARFQKTLSLELRQAQLNNETAVRHSERTMFFRVGNETQEAPRQQRAHMVHEQHQLVEEGEAHRNVARHHMESEQRASLRILESVPQECDPTLFVRRPNIFANNYHRAEQAALLSREEVE